MRCLLVRFFAVLAGLWWEIQGDLSIRMMVRVRNIWSLREMCVWIAAFAKFEAFEVFSVFADFGGSHSGIAFRIPDYGDYFPGELMGCIGAHGISRA